MEIEVETPGPVPDRSCPDIVIRPSSDADVEAMVAIYEHHISRGVGDVGVAEEDRLLPDDLKRVAPSVLEHRMLVAPDAQLRGVTDDDVVRAILASVPVPGATGG